MAKVTTKIIEGTAQEVVEGLVDLIFGQAGVAGLDEAKNKIDEISYIRTFLYNVAAIQGEPTLSTIRTRVREITAPMINSLKDPEPDNITLDELMQLITTTHSEMAAYGNPFRERVERAIGQIDFSDLLTE